MTDRRSGLNAMAAIKIQPAGYGTEIAVTTGDRILSSNIAPADGLTRAPNADELTGRYNTRMVETDGQPMLDVSGPALYYGLTDLIFAMAMGAVSGVTTTPFSLGAAKQREYTENTDLETCATAVWTDDSDIEVIAVPDCFLKSFTLTIPENGECTIQANLLTGVQSNASATNAKTQIDAVTFPLTCKDVGIAHMLHASVQLWRKYGTAAVIPAKSVTITYDSGLSEDNRTTKNTTGNTLAMPVRNAKPQWGLTLQLHAETTSAFAQGWDDDAVYHCIITLTDTFGSAGSSKSGLNPSIDLSGAGNGSVKVSLITGETAQNAALTVAALNSGNLIAAALQVAIRALTSTDATNQRAYEEATCVYTATATPGVTDYYTITPGGHYGAISAPVITAGTSGNDHSAALKLGAANGGTEQVGAYNVFAFYFPELHFSAPYVRDITSISRKQSPLSFVATACDVVSGATLVTEFTAAGDALLEYDADTGPVIVVRNERSSDLI